MDKVWINEVTGDMSEADPSATDRGSNASNSTHASLIEGTIRYNKRRNVLAARGEKMAIPMTCTIERRPRKHPGACRRRVITVASSYYGEHI